jgi:hypothetical protein
MQTQRTVGANLFIAGEFSLGIEMGDATLRDKLCMIDGASSKGEWIQRRGNWSKRRPAAIEEATVSW